MKRIRTIEGHSARAWPAQTATPISGWELRLSPLLSSRRTNSLNAVAPEAGRFETVLRMAQSICRDQGVPCHVRLQPLAGQEPIDHLKSLGLQGGGETIVETLAVSGGHPVDPRVILAEELSDLWLDTYASTHHYSATESDAIRSALSSVAIPQGFAVALDEGVPCAVGRAAIHDGLLGLFQIATLPNRRRKGFGRAIMSALLEWGREKGADKAYLQVESGNVAARTLYENLGFQPLYTYDYWTLPKS